MTKALVTKDSIDLGIVVSDPDLSLAFYRDLLGFELLGEMKMPGDGHMFRLLCGSTILKLVKAPTNPAQAAGGGINGACGFRYFTISVSNLHEVTQACADAGRTIAVPPFEIRTGITISIVEDPDGNLVEFLEVA